MTKSKFQLVGSLLRPADLRKFKDEIEHRDDIQYPFYDALPGYQETETADIKQIVADQKANGIDIITDGEFGRSMWHLDFVWGFKGIERTLLSMATLLKTMMVANMRLVKILVFVLLNHSRVKTTIT